MLTGRISFPLVVYIVGCCALKLLSDRQPYLNSAVFFFCHHYVQAWFGYGYFSFSNSSLQASVLVVGEACDSSLGLNLGNNNLSSLFITGQAFWTYHIIVPSTSLG